MTATAYAALRRYRTVRATWTIDFARRTAAAAATATAPATAPTIAADGRDSAPMPRRLGEGAAGAAVD